MNQGQLFATGYFIACVLLWLVALWFNFRGDDPSGPPGVWTSPGNGEVCA